ncbi:acyl-[acyl-carrier-protein]--UDP-N-acetylglucosamine O-acyltransferase [Pseudaminobacter salicylatoxidans]|uniref:Acyl-[acyl-carrier-protein]--UDP-N-acetylglucosamine O-acyltransferase n=1 Tax=Pseudaminobacter salicylatoxidans TaxID=93369 RepID=A0A316C7X0_PSESE|nr:acyl-ACP--UDP-N-acetylglucosamine O-acyltransferase [Pseudaminobacter salicylatoxidans]PWJ85760.1 acyl-[acyl-carrier-protein]--UDP-N-acetylglucosamine O-acyltransferase [Pseudaminobacter salicylatoxidans]
MQTETFIHPSAVVEDGAQLGANVHVGPFCHVGPEVSIGDGTRLVSHVAISGATTIGSGCSIHPQAALGGPPQNNAHKGGRTTLTIGDNCTIREYVTMHVGTDNARGATTIGSNCTFLTYTHVGHDCVLGNNITMAAGAMLAGHVELGDNVGIGGLTGVHQFVRVGRGAFLAGGSMVIGDVLPFTLAMGNRAKLRGLNVVGLRRSGMTRSDMLILRRAYKTLFDRSRPVSENIEIAQSEFAGSPIAMEMVDFIRDRGKRLYTVPPLKGAVDDDADDQG